MKLEMITEGLKKLLLENHYNPATIRFYEREWKKIHAFLINEYGDTGFEMERGLKYLEKQYNLITKYNDGSLSQQRVQLLRVVHMLEDYRLHGVLTRRYYASKNPLALSGGFELLFHEYTAFLDSSELSTSTINHYKKISVVFMDYLSQCRVSSVEQVTMDTCNSYLKTLAGYSFKTVEQNVCGIRHFLRFLHSTGKISADYAEKIHMPSISKNARIPSSWRAEELKAMLACIDRKALPGSVIMQ